MKINKLYMTRSINDNIAENSDFSKFICDSIGKYNEQNWGEVSQEDRELNDIAVNSENRIIAKYSYRERSIFIITEWDKKYTTILFVEEY